NGAGTSFAEQNYQYLDRYAPNGIAYYRLSQTDYNGETTTAKEVVVLQRTQSHATLQIEQVYGLGNTNEVYLNINNPQTSPVRLQVYSITGQLLHTQTYQTQAGSNVLWCNSQVWAKGVYTFVVQSDTETAVAKWCKQ
ncbi:MAG TPA: T9SS type A sorting domain-containing protein, partial [Chitinophagales bacterium]|nr:T9SS type A sorting domain-containing protein [Chitinophagales bacterium]